MKIAYVRSYTSTDYHNAKASSDAIGYGRACSLVLERELGKLRSTELITVATPDDVSLGLTSWNMRQITQLVDVVKRDEIDAVFLFHSTTPDAAFVRRNLDEIGFQGTLVGYTHGSHWDPSDTFRYDNHPKLKWEDLGLLLSMDRILLASEYIRTRIAASVRAEAVGALNEFLTNSRVVGIPIDIEGIDRNRGLARSTSPRLLFNHSFVSSKGADEFVDMLPVLLEQNKALSVDITRAPIPGSQTEGRLRTVCSKFGQRVRVHEGLDPSAYASLLWQCTHQVSTATHETFGVATAEAMAAGVACLVPDRAVYPELVGRSTKEAIYDPSFKLQRLTEWLGMDEATRRDIATRQCNSVRTRFNGRAVAAAVGEVIRKCILT